MRREAPHGFNSRSFFEGVYWHQDWEIFPGVRTPGRSGVAHMLHWCGVPDRLDGKRVLDVGAWNGCVSFECERRGAAEVVALSLEDPATTGFDRLSSVLEVARTRYVRGTIYDLNPDRLGLFDLVICFGVIYHLRYPVLGIDNLRRVANGDLYLETHISDAELGDAAQKPLLQFYPGDELVHASNWFGPTSTAVNLLLETAGFSIRTSKVVDGTRGYYRAAVKPGLPPFVGMFQDQHTYEEQYYDVNLSHLFGPLESLRR